MRVYVYTMQGQSWSLVKISKYGYARIYATRGELKFEVSIKFRLINPSDLPLILSFNLIFVAVCELVKSTSRRQLLDPKAAEMNMHNAYYSICP